MRNCVTGGFILTIQGSGHGPFYKVILTRRPVLKNDSTIEGLGLCKFGDSGDGHVTAPMPAATLPTESRVECCSQASVQRECVCV